MNDSHHDAKRQVALFGTFDTDNFGDCLFPLIVKQQLCKRLESIELFPVSPTNKTATIADFPAVYGFHELGDMFDAQLPSFIIGGGALLSTEHVLFSYPELRLTYPYSLKCWLLPAIVSKVWNCPLIVNGIGLGPFDSGFRELAANYLNHAVIRGVRDDITREFLSDIGVESEIVPDCGILTPELLPDSVWETRYCSLKNEFNLPEKYIAVQASLYLESQLERFAENIADVARQMGLPVVLVPICHHLNDRVAARIMKRIFHNKGVATTGIERILSTIETSALLSRASLFVGTSLHGALVTLSFQKPVVSFSLNTMKKNRTVLAVLTAEDWVENDPSRLPDIIQKALRSSPTQRRAELDKAQAALSIFFDRISEVIWSQSGTQLKRPLSFRMASRELMCEAVQKDLDCINRLCAQYRRSVPIARRCGAVLVRNNRRLSEWYDRIMHWAVVRKAAGHQ